MTRLLAATTADMLATVQPLHVAAPDGAVDLDAAARTAADLLHLSGSEPTARGCAALSGGWPARTPNCSLRRHST
jgi:hypothetical protein